MTAQVPEAARRVAGRIADAFEQDQGLAEQLNEAQGRLADANRELWSGLHPDALSLLYDHTAAAGISQQARLKSRVTAVIADQRGSDSDPDAVETVVLQVVQEIHWTIHRAFSDYQQISEDRRHLAAEIGELIAGLVAELVAAGWSEDQARQADVHQLAAAVVR